MAKTRRARIDAENDHRRVTRPRLRIVVKETQGYPTGYLRTQSDTIQHCPESREVGYGFSIILHGSWLCGPIWMILMDLKPNVANFFYTVGHFFGRKKNRIHEKKFGCEFGFFFCQTKKCHTVGKKKFAMFGFRSTKNHPNRRARIGSGKNC